MLRLDLPLINNVIQFSNSIPSIQNRLPKIYAFIQYLFFNISTLEIINLSIYIPHLMHISQVRNSIRFLGKSITRRGSCRAMNIGIRKWRELCECIVVAFAHI